jgi:hypothetical protein
MQIAGVINRAAPDVFVSVRQIVPFHRVCLHLNFDLSASVDLAAHVKTLPFLQRVTDGKFSVPYSHFHHRQANVGGDDVPQTGFRIRVSQQGFEHPIVGRRQYFGNFVLAKPFEHYVSSPSVVFYYILAGHDAQRRQFVFENSRADSFINMEVHTPELTKIPDGRIEDLRERELVNWLRRMIYEARQLANGRNGPNRSHYFGPVHRKNSVAQVELTPHCL